MSDTIIAIYVIAIGVIVLAWSISTYRKALNRRRHREHRNRWMAYQKAWDRVMGLFKQPRQLTYQPRATEGTQP